MQKKIKILLLIAAIAIPAVCPAAIWVTGGRSVSVSGGRSKLLRDLGGQRRGRDHAHGRGVHPGRAVGNERVRRDNADGVRVVGIILGIERSRRNHASGEINHAESEKNLLHCSLPYF